MSLLQSTSSLIPFVTGRFRREVVAVLEKNRFGQPVLEFETGSQFNLNVTNNRNPHASVGL